MGVELGAFAVVTELREQCKELLTRDADFIMLDEEYWLPPLGDVVDLMDRVRVDKKQFRADVHDCDDFALALQYHMMASQEGNPARRLPHAFGMVHGMVGPTYAHAINIMLNQDGAVRFVEPQEDPSEAVYTVETCPLTSIFRIWM